MTYPGPASLFREHDPAPMPSAVWEQPDWPFGAVVKSDDSEAFSGVAVHHVPTEQTMIFMFTKRLQRPVMDRAVQRI